MSDTSYNGTDISLILQGSDEKGSIAEAVLNDAKGPKLKLDPTAVFATKELAGQVAYDTACEFIRTAQMQPRKRA